MKIITTFSIAGFFLPILNGTASASPPQEIPVVNSPTPQPRPLGSRDPDKDKMIKDLEDRDPGVRLSAARSLKTRYPMFPDAAAALLTALDRRGEQEALRREIIKDLASFSPFPGVWGRLLEAAEDYREPSDIRSIAFKALYVQLAGYAQRNPNSRGGYQIRDSLQRALQTERDPAVRRAAAWGLFVDDEDYRTRSLLLGSAIDSTGEPGLRLEAIKSLFSAVKNHPEVAGAMQGLAANGLLDIRLRQAAILSLAEESRDWRARNLLEGIERGDSQPILRQAATAALGGVTQNVARFFHLDYFNGVSWLDPLDGE